MNDVLEMSTGSTFITDQESYLGLSSGDVLYVRWVEQETSAVQLKAGGFDLELDDTNEAALALTALSGLYTAVVM